MILMQLSGPAFVVTDSYTCLLCLNKFDTRALLGTAVRFMYAWMVQSAFLHSEIFRFINKAKGQRIKNQYKGRLLKATEREFMEYIIARIH